MTDEKPQNENEEQDDRSAPIGRETVETVAKGAAVGAAAGAAVGAAAAGAREAMSRKDESSEEDDDSGDAEE
jgi:hypothetical protein